MIGLLTAAPTHAPGVISFTIEQLWQMILSIADGVDREAFDASEKKQDEATDEISFAIQRMTALLLKK